MSHALHVYRPVILKTNKREHKVRFLRTIIISAVLWSYCSLEILTPNTNLHGMIQSELHWPISWNSVESDLESTSRIYYDNVTLTLHNMPLTSNKPCKHNNKRDCSTTKGCVFLIKFRYRYICIAMFYGKT